MGLIGFNPWLCGESQDAACVPKNVGLGQAAQDAIVSTRIVISIRNQNKCPKTFTWWWQLKYFWNVHPYLRKISNLTCAYFSGWFNHQADRLLGCTHFKQPGTTPKEPVLDGCFNWMMNQIFAWEVVGNHQPPFKTGCLGPPLGCPRKLVNG